MNAISNITITLSATLFLLGSAQADSKDAETSSTMDKVQKVVEKSGKAAVGGIERGAKATGKFVERGAKAAGSGIEKGVHATENALGIKPAQSSAPASAPANQ